MSTEEIRATQTDFVQNPNSNISHHRSAVRWATGCFITFACYATIRYNVFKGVPWGDWPVYILNKVFGLASLSLLLIAALQYGFRKCTFNPKLIHVAGLFGIMHSIISSFMLGPVYYPGLFMNGKLTLSAATSMLLGSIVILAFVLGGKNAGSRSSTIRIRGVAVLAFAAGIHASLLGFQGWVNPREWPGGMPPLTIISFLMGSMALAMAWRQKIGRPSHDKHSGKNPPLSP
jgi:hypothetical protein